MGMNTQSPARRRWILCFHRLRREDNAAERNLPGVARSTDDGALWGVPDPAEAKGTEARKSRSRSKMPIVCCINASEFSRHCRCGRSIN